VSGEVYSESGEHQELEQGVVMCEFQSGEHWALAGCCGM
jgi:hypothetical protein